MTSTEHELVKNHGHCADLLMKDFGIDTKHRVSICKEIDQIWKQNTMIHCMIIWSVRGFMPDRATASLESFLHQHKTHPQENSKSSVFD